MYNSEKNQAVDNQGRNEGVENAFLHRLKNIPNKLVWGDETGKKAFKKSVKHLQKVFDYLGEFGGRIEVEQTYRWNLDVEVVYIHEDKKRVLIGYYDYRNEHVVFDTLYTLILTMDGSDIKEVEILKRECPFYSGTAYIDSNDILHHSDGKTEKSFPTLKRLFSDFMLEVVEVRPFLGEPFKVIKFDKTLEDNRSSFDPFDLSRLDKFDDENIVGKKASVKSIEYLQRVFDYLGEYGGKVKTELPETWWDLNLEVEYIHEDKKKVIICLCSSWNGDYVATPSFELLLTMDGNSIRDIDILWLDIIFFGWNAYVDKDDIFHYPNGQTREATPNLQRAFEDFMMGVVEMAPYLSNPVKVEKYDKILEDD